MEILDGGSCPNCGGTLGLIDANCGCRCVKVPRISTPADKGAVRLEVEEVETESDILLRAKVLENSDTWKARSDDALLITTEWVESSFPQGDRENWYVIECDNMVYFEIDSHGEDCFSWWIGGCGWDGARFKTRGDVRRFLWYMQAEMIP